MPMNPIKFREWHRLNESWDSLDFKEMPDTIDHNSSMLSYWLVNNSSQLYFIVFNKLRKCL